MGNPSLVFKIVITGDSYSILLLGKESLNNPQYTRINGIETSKPCPKGIDNPLFIDLMLRKPF